MLDYAKRHIGEVLGCVANDLDLIRGDEYILQEEDFLSQSYQTIFIGLQDLAMKHYDMKSIKPMDLDNYLSQYADAYKIFKIGKGLEYITRVMEGSNKDLFKYNYEMLRKYSLLNMYEQKGYSIKVFIDKEEESLKKKAQQVKELESVTEETINNTMLLGVMSVRDGWLASNSSTQKSYKIGDNLEANSEDIAEGGELGYNMPNRQLNTIFKGIPKGKLFLISGGTNAGKTRTFIEYAVHFTCKKIYNANLGKWVDNPNPVIPTLLTVNELDLKEVQTIMRAIVSGVPTGVILDGHYGELIKQRLDEANEIIKEAPLYVEELDDFEVTEYKALLEKHILTHQVEAVIHDYIELTPALSRSVAETFGVQGREDLVLQRFAHMLNKIAEEFNCVMISGTQLNAKMMDGYYETRLAGGQATARKTYMGMICDSVRPDEMAKLTTVLESVGEAYKPNYCYHIYKNRRGNRYINVYVKRNLGNMRDTYCFATNYDYELIDDIPETVYNFEGEKQGIENAGYIPIDKEEDGKIDF